MAWNGAWNSGNYFKAVKMDEIENTPAGSPPQYHQLNDGVTNIGGKSPGYVGSYTFNSWLADQGSTPPTSNIPKDFGGWSPIYSTIQNQGATPLFCEGMWIDTNKNNGVQETDRTNLPYNLDGGEANGVDNANATGNISGPAPFTAAATAMHPGASGSTATTPKPPTSPSPTATPLPSASPTSGPNPPGTTAGPLNHPSTPSPPNKSHENNHQQKRPRQSPRHFFFVHPQSRTHATRFCHLPDRFAASISARIGAFRRYRLPSIRASPTNQLSRPWRRLLCREDFLFLPALPPMGRSKTVGKPVTRLPFSYMSEARSDDDALLRRAFGVRLLTTFEPTVF